MKDISNRSYFLITPKSPLVSWVNGYDDNLLPAENILSHKSLYLVESLDIIAPEDIRKLIKKHYVDIFENELFGWYEDEDYFPKDMSFNLFIEWFDYEYIEMGHDLLDTEIVFFE